MLVIGLCGGSGSGKSTVAALLSSHNILHIDTDAVYRELVSQPSACMKELAEEFGASIVKKDGALDRKALAEIVFADKLKHNALNRIAHSHVLNKVREVILTSSEYFAVCVDAPMLFESGFDKECDVLVAVIAPIEKRIRRITERDKISDEAAIKRINAQLSDDELITRVDFVITNEDNLTALEKQTTALVNYIKNKFK